ncbi:hypothetical protein [Pseudomonas sp. IAC-BECa141]|uniref:hypothetical protein n=1 Tax=Pseudomonas sp. IAC-BECa141 TaxID=2793103 RepID=UPI001D05F801|nr:hypothetical protein [Pseudomonas sp. IAC-BECa141]UDI94813.1 hypothetical protein I5961_09920 [Pseudomonas sp. IAC-BECa141]
MARSMLPRNLACGHGPLRCNAALILILWSNFCNWLFAASPETFKVNLSVSFALSSRPLFSQKGLLQDSRFPVDNQKGGSITVQRMIHVQP